ncbi:MAG TPA: hypothetical protein VMF59_14615, partial [Bacteroidota bacterium]|nr:hypothetical protein [Bacteroidota bacterium]
MRKALPPLVKVLGGMVIGILSLIGSGTLFYLYFHSSSEVPVGIAVAPAPGTTNPPQTATQMATATTVQFDTPLRIWGTRYLVIPIGFPGHQQVSELKSRAGMKEDNTLVNVAIVNEQTDQANLVFDRPMAIGRIDAPRDSLQRHRQLIVYTAHIADSDSNGVINGSDNGVLFISSFDG